MVFKLGYVAKSPGKLNNINSQAYIWSFYYPNQFWNPLHDDDDDDDDMNDD